MMIPEGTGKKLVSRRPDLVKKLSPRELEVCELMLCGMESAEAAKAIHRSPETITSHLKLIYRKLDVGSRAELILAFAVCEPPPPPKVEDDAVESEAA